VSFSNSLYDPAYETLGLPVDPHLRMFQAMAGNYNQLPFLSYHDYNLHKFIAVHLLFTVTCQRKFTILHASITLILSQKSSSFLKESSCSECSSRGERVSHVRLKSAWDSHVDSAVQSNPQT